MAERPPVRCAVYTRKSSDEGLEQSFNSLHAQREACEAYVLSQKHEGWTLVPTAYDDGGFSGGSMDRPGLKSLMHDVEAGLVDTVVVYKVDRLTRALADFAKMVERFDKRSVSFVSVTQAFNTTTSMGRLTLNVLLSFAQFEREVTGERIRDKIAASKARGMWMGGSVPLGYDIVERMLIINEPEAGQVRQLFSLYANLKAVDDVVAAAATAGITSKRRTNIAGRKSGGAKLGRGSLYAILANPIYVGEIAHKGKRYPGQHSGIVEPAVFDQVQAILEANRRKARGTGTSDSPMLSGLVTDPAGTRMTATHTGKGNRRYRYYASSALRVPAKELEALVTTALTQTLGSPANLAGILPDLTLLSEALISAAAKLARQLSLAELTGGLRLLATEFIDSVQLSSDHVTTTVRLAVIGGTGTACITTPATIARARAKLSLVVPGSTAARPDPALTSVVAQARCWLARLTSGECATISAVAAAHHVTDSYVRNWISAGFLAPDIVTGIVEGRQPAWLTRDTLATMLPLPADWHDQRQLFVR